MIKIERVTQAPPEVLEHANEYVASNSLTLLHKMCTLSDDVRYVTDELGRPLLLIGAYRASLFDTRLEMWMVATKFVTIAHMVEGRRHFRAWAKQQNVHLIARCQSEMAAKFVRLMGFVKSELISDYPVYEVKP